MHHAAEKAADIHLIGLINQLARARTCRWITPDAVDRYLAASPGTVVSLESGHHAPLLTVFVAWSRALGLTLHLSDEYGRILPAWNHHRPPHDTDARFESARLIHGLDLRREAIPCDTSVLTEHLGLDSAAWCHWREGTQVPNLLAIVRACIALDVRINLVGLWHEPSLTSVRTMQVDSSHPPGTASNSCG